MIKWVVRLAFITCLLGLVGTIAIIMHLHVKREDEKVVKDERKLETSISSLKINPEKPKKADTATSPKPVVVVKKEDTVAKISPSQKEIETSKTVIAKTEVKKKDEPKMEDAGKVLKKTNVQKSKQENLLNRAELIQLVDRINKAKVRYALYSNCIQIEGNNKKTISQVERSLRSHRFTIAGREVIEKKVKGIQISPNGGCLRITIGTF